MVARCDSRRRAERRSRGNDRSRRPPATWRALPHRDRGRPLARQRLRGRDELVEVGHVRVLVPPRSEHRTVLTDEERAPPRHAFHPPPDPRGAEPLRERAVPIGQQRHVDTERFLPGAVRPVRVARDAEGADARTLEVGPPVTQESQLLRSGRRPVEEVEEEQDGTVLEQLLELGFLAGVEPEHASNLLAETAPAVDCGERARAELARHVRDARICRRPSCGRTRAGPLRASRPPASGRRARGRARRSGRTPRADGEPLARRRDRRRGGCEARHDRARRAVRVTMRTDPSRRPYASTCAGPGRHTGASAAACRSSRWSPFPSPPTTRSSLPDRYAIRVSVRVPPQRGKPTSGRASDQRTSPPGSARRARSARDATTKRPKGDHEASRYGRGAASIRPRSTTQAPEPAVTSSRPGAGSEKSAGCASRRRRPRGSRRAPPGRAG